MNWNSRERSESTETGQMLVVEAISERGDVLAVVRVEIPVDVGIELAKQLGNRLSGQEIKKAAHNLLVMLVKCGEGSGIGRQKRV